MTPARSLAAACRLALPLSALLCAGAAQAAPVVTITSNDVNADVASGLSTTPISAVDRTTTTRIPHSELLDATFDATWYSRVQLDYGVANGVTSLSNQLTHGRGGNRSGYTWGYAETFLTVDADTSYELSGRYAVTHVGAAGNVYLNSYLYSVTTSSYLFNNTQESYDTVNEVFVLGGSGGDSVRAYHAAEEGSLTGQLTAGHAYKWGFEAYTWARLSADSGDSATGNITLRIGDRSDLDAAASAIPEPGTLALAGLSLAGLMLARRRRTAR